MFIIVEHEISNPKSFWEKVQMSDIPSKLKLHQSMPSETGTKAVCVWEADDINDVSQFVEDAVGQWSKNTYFSVEAEKAIGLPAAVTV